MEDLIKQVIKKDGLATKHRHVQLVNKRIYLYTNKERRTCYKTQARSVSQ